MNRASPSRRRRPSLAGLVVAAIVMTACGGDDDSTDGDASAGGGGSANEFAIASADEVIQVVDSGFVPAPGKAIPGEHDGGVSYGFVLENVSDKVALSIRTDVVFLDAAGTPLDGSGGGADFTVMVPGQRMGAGGFAVPEGGDVAGMDVRVTLISALDTVDGQRHRDPPGPYSELQVSAPVLDPERSTTPTSPSWTEWVEFEVTNTYDLPLTPSVFTVSRGPDGTIIGGTGGTGTDSLASTDVEIPPGGSATADAKRTISYVPALEGAATEAYADPVLGWLVGLDPVWQSL